MIPCDRKASTTDFLAPIFIDFDVQSILSLFLSLASIILSLADMILFTDLFQSPPNSRISCNICLISKNTLKICWPTMGKL
jgi:hypothetical protein